MSSARPSSVADIAAAAQAGYPFDFAVREFLDAFYESPGADRPAKLSNTPLSLGPVKDAYLGAVAQHLALRFGLTPPDWTEDPSRFLSQPFFSGGMEGMKALLLLQSPLAFRRRLIFVSEDALSRPRDMDNPALKGMA